MNELEVKFNSEGNITSIVMKDDGNTPAQMLSRLTEYIEKLQSDIKRSQEYVYPTSKGQSNDNT